MKMQLVWIAACVFGGMACSAAGGVDQPKRLYAPGYYIALFAQIDYGDTIRVRGASNLPPGASVGLDVVATNDDGWTEYSKTVCVTTSAEGLFNQEITTSTGLPHRTDLLVRATFLTNSWCKQSAYVLQVVGNHGEFLGNDAHHVTMEEVEKGITPGMAQNPELFQVSGWYFGISAIARVD
ncbi:MAG: hypothetical protein ACLQM6_13510 [Acidobacteriaceae bacterium]